MKKSIFPHWLTPAQAKAEADRVEQLQEKRRAARRLAHEIFLIKARATQDEQVRQEELRWQAFERREWDETMISIQMIWHEYEFGD